LSLVCTNPWREALCVKGARPRAKAKAKGKVQVQAKEKAKAKVSTRKEGQGISKGRRAHQGKQRLAFGKVLTSTCNLR
jgi:hypothetical protein